MSHLILDEIYAVEWTGGRWRFKKSFGTALKLWGKSGWANISTYAKLLLVFTMILGEPMVMDRYGTNYPIALDRNAIQSQIAGTFQEGYPATGPTPGITPQGYAVLPPNGEQPSPEVDQTIYDTARRLWLNFGGAK